MTQQIRIIARIHKSEKQPEGPYTKFRNPQIGQRAQTRSAQTGQRAHRHKSIFCQKAQRHKLKNRWRAQRQQSKNRPESPAALRPSLLPTPPPPHPQPHPLPPSFAPAPPISVHKPQEYHKLDPCFFTRLRISPKEGAKEGVGK